MMTSAPLDCHVVQRRRRSLREQGRTRLAVVTGSVGRDDSLPELDHRYRFIRMPRLMSKCHTTPGLPILPESDDPSTGFHHTD